MEYSSNFTSEKLFNIYISSNTLTGQYKLLAKGLFATGTGNLPYNFFSLDVAILIY